jgi:hypothetical protein
VPLLDLSPTGLKISAGQELDLETVLLVDVLPGQTLRARVKWCRPEDENFLIGAEWESPITFDEVWKIRSSTDA